MIADPNLARRARAGEPVTTLHRLQPGLHRPLPRRRPDRLHRQPVDGIRAHPAPPRGRGRPARDRGRRRRRPGRMRRRRLRRRARAPGRRVRARRAAQAARCGSRSRAPGHAEIAAGAARDPGRWLAAVRRPLRRRGSAPSSVLAERPDRVVVATGAEPHVPALAGDGVAVVHAWAALAGAPVGERVRRERLGRRLDRPRRRPRRSPPAAPRCGWSRRRSRSARASTSTSATSTWPGSTTPASSSSTTCAPSRWRPGRSTFENVFSGAAGRDRRRRHARGERRPHGRRRPLRRAAEAGVPVERARRRARARARSRRRSARAPWPASGREDDA